MATNSEMKAAFEKVLAHLESKLKDYINGYTNNLSYGDAGTARNIDLGIRINGLKKDIENTKNAIKYYEN